MAVQKGNAVAMLDNYLNLVQRISVAVQKGNAAAMLGTVAKESDLDVSSLYE